MLLGYNTNGFAHHSLEDALLILADLGYSSIALTLDHHALNPYDPDLSKQLFTVERVLRQRGLRCVIETGARFLLNPWHKHQPTLLDPFPELRGQRMHFLERAIDLARELQADAVSFWSGQAPATEPEDVLMDRLVAGCQRLCDLAGARGVRLAFEPEPGMFIDTMPRYAELYQRVDHPAFGLTLDIGHLHCLGEIPIRKHIRAWHSQLWNIHLEDMRQGIHDHLMFGEGEIEFTEILHTLQEINYEAGVHIELSRHSFNAVETARQAMRFLKDRGW